MARRGPRARRGGRRRGTRASSSTRAGSRRGRRCTRTRRPRRGPGTSVAPVEVGDDAAHRVVRGRRDGDGLRLRDGSRRRRSAPSARESATGRSGAGRASRCRAPRSRARRRRAARAPRRSGRRCSSSEQRAVAAQRLGLSSSDEPGQRGRMELHELEIRDGRARAVRHRDPFADRAGRIRRASPERCVAAGREQRRRARRIARASVTSPTQRPSDSHSSSARSPSLTSMRGCASTARASTREISRAGLRAADAVHAPARMAALEPELLVEGDAEVGEVDDPRGRLLRQRAHGALAAEPRPATSVSSACSSGASSARGRGRDAALREPARRGQHRPLRDEQDAALGRRAERSVEAGDAAADDDQVVVSVMSAKFPTAS